MSAAEPMPGLDAISSASSAPVIDITTRRGRQATRPERWTMEGTTPDGEQDAVQGLAEHIETTFIDNQMTLSNEDTAAAYVLTLRIAQGVVRSAQANGVIDEAQRLELHELLEGMVKVPDRIV